MEQTLPRNWLAVTRSLVYRVFGAVLLVAVALKVAGIGSGSLSAPGRTTTGVPLLFVGVELLLGLWVVSGTAARAGRVVAIAVLTLFVGVNVVKAYEGASSCGCFGAVTVPPGYVAAVEAMFIAVLVPFPRRSEWTSADGSAAWVAGMAAVLLGAYLGVGYATTGRVSADWLTRGDPAATIEQHIPGDEPGAVTEFELRWQNTGSEPVQLTFLRAYCGCLQTRALPVWVAPGEEAVVPVAFTAPTGRGTYLRKFEIVTTTAPLAGLVHRRVRDH